MISMMFSMIAMILIAVYFPLNAVSVSLIVLNLICFIFSFIRSKR